MSSPEITGRAAVDFKQIFHQPLNPDMSQSQPSLPIEHQVSATTESAGQSINEGQGRIFPCEGCGADLKFNIGQQHLKCPYCGFEKQLEIASDAEIAEQDFHAMLERMRELHKDDHAETSTGDEQRELSCDSCGGTVVFIGSLTSSECPYCASPIQRDKIHDAIDRIPVDGVLPFLVERDQAHDNLKTWVKSRWFAPSKFVVQGVRGTFNGIYLPFWTYDTMTYSRYSGQRGEYYWVTVGTGDKKRRERRTRWYPASGDFQRFFDDVLVLAAKGLRRDFMLNLEPWPLGRCIPFTQQVLAGYMAKTYEIPLDTGFEEARQRIDNALLSDVRSRIGGDTQQIHSVDTQYDALTFKHLLLPVWLLVYRYHDKSYQVMINAATGEVQGERPYSWVKILFTVLAVAGVGLGLAAAFSR